MTGVKALIECKNLEISFPSVTKQKFHLRKPPSSSMASPRSFTALRGLNVLISKGEHVGLLGNNGAGKSTFLRTMAGVFYPTDGEVCTQGRISTIFEATVGADPDLTGYDNIPLMLAARKIPKSLLNEVIKDVEEFTELGEALTRPFGTYSQGMKLRLAFAIATFQEAEILLIDEQIGVGDRDFQAKARNRIISLIQNSGSLVLASHSNFILREFCSRGLVFDSGSIVFDGSIEDAIDFQESR